MTTQTTFKASNGKDASGEISQPGGQEKVPGVILIHEWWGINDHVRSRVKQLAADGFVALAPDLFRGVVAKARPEAAKLMNELDHGQAMSDIEGALAALKGNARCNGKVGIIGFCMGGAIALEAAALVPGLACSVPFYGPPESAKADLSKIAIPVQAHFSTRDQWAKAASAEALKKTLSDKGVAMQLHLYDAAHAFMNDTRPEVYDPECAKTAWGRTVEFLRQQLS
jgi:carboxymethylenebutenolidase